MVCPENWMLKQENDRKTQGSGQLFEQKMLKPQPDRPDRHIKKGMISYSANKLSVRVTRCCQHKNTKGHGINHDLTTIPLNDPY